MAVKKSTRKRPSRRTVQRRAAEARDEATIRVQAEAHLAEVAAEPPKHGKYPAALLEACGRVAYDSFVRESGYSKHASIQLYDEQKTFVKARWERVARDILDTKARFEDHYP
jgi:hypothetical protein